MSSPDQRVRPATGIRSDAEAPATRGARTARPAVPVTRLLFLLTLTLLATVYTVMAFGMEWRVQAGQIGPGFFPRLVGGATVVGCLLAIVGCLRTREASSRAPDGEGDRDVSTGGGSGREPWVTVVALVCMVLFYAVFEVLGALLSSVLFLGLLLTIVNRGHHKLNAGVALLVPVGLYLLFEVALDAGLPPGLVLPL
jgi:putative tricarboxylic transport membrane protein